MKQIIAFILLALCASGVFAAETIYTKVYSEANGKRLPVSMIIPDAYHADKTARFPVMYILTGRGSDTKSLFLPEDDIYAADILTAAADKYGILMVVPDSDKDSWYLDNPGRMYETFCGKEIVAYMDKHYRTIADRDHRIIVGNSMGGHGALLLSRLNPETFGIVGALAPVTDLTTTPSKDKIKYGSKPREEVNSLPNAAAYKDLGLNLYIEIGFHDFLYDMNIAFHKALKDAGVDHVYVEREGHHNKPFWRPAWRAFIPYAVDKMKESEK